MNEQTVRDRLRAYILEDLLKEPDYPLQDDEPIVSTGMIDSFSLADVGVFAEQEFNVFIPDPDLTVAKMDTLDLMVARIMRDL